MKPPAGAVLTGGASRRMGRPKAWLPVDGVPMAAGVAAALTAGGCSPVRFVGAAPDPELDIRIATVADLEPGEGPLGGVLTALRSCETDVVVAACDLPLLDRDDVRAVLLADPGRRADVVVATADGHHVPLALWRRSALPVVTEIFASGIRSWRGALEALQTLDVPIGARHAHDVDTPGDLRSATARDRATAHRARPDASG